MIYLKLEGRLGNQIFMYAAARELQKQRAEQEEILIDDSCCIETGFINSLEHYELNNVRFFHEDKLEKLALFKTVSFWLKIWEKFQSKCRNAGELAKFQSKYQRIINKFGIYYMINGYTFFSKSKRKNIYMHGYFQSPKYFEHVKREIIRIFRDEKYLNSLGLNELDLLQNTNSVCISIRLGADYTENPMYNVCDMEYWKKSIEYIKKKVVHPVFYICSDDIEKVHEFLPEVFENEYIEQNVSFPPYVTLAVMAQCKHFILSNSSFSWWAQYLGNDRDKIVIAPRRWYTTDMPCDLYMDNWITL